MRGIDPEGLACGLPEVDLLGGRGQIARRFSIWTVQGRIVTRYVPQQDPLAADDYSVVRLCRPFIGGASRIAGLRGWR